MVKNLKEFRLKKGISQQVLADILGISQQSINKYENHKIEPDISTLIAMADYFDTTVDHLIGRTDASGKRLKPSDSEHLFEKYITLDDNEKKCISIIINTFYEQKKSL